MNDQVARWHVPVWSDADRTLILGRIPSRIDDCSDPVGARLYLGCRARNRIHDWILGKRPVGLKQSLWACRRIWQETRTIELGLHDLGRNVAKVLGGLNRQLANLAQESERIHRCNITISAPRSQDLTQRFWAGQASSIAGEVRNAGGLVVVHGSQADGSTTRYSDIDLWMIGDIADSRFRTWKQQLDTIVLDADPLQHHGVFFVDRADLEAYWPMQLPVSTLMRSAALDVSSDLSLRVMSEPYGGVAALRGVLNSWELLLDGSLQIRGMWDWKYKMSQFMLIPTLLWAAGGRHDPKEQSFGFFEDLYSDIAWDAMSLVSQLRADWPECSYAPVYREHSERAFGRLMQDPMAVPVGLRLWEDTDFRKRAGKLIHETYALANLCDR